MSTGMRTIADRRRDCDYYFCFHFHIFSMDTKKWGGVANGFRTIKPPARIYSPVLPNIPSAGCPIANNNVRLARAA